MGFRESPIKWEPEIWTRRQIKAETDTDTLNIGPDFSFREGLLPTLLKPEYRNHLGSSKSRTKAGSVDHAQKEVLRLNEVDDYFRKDTELQNYTKTGVKRIINPFYISK